MSSTSSLTDRRRLAPRTSEDEALFIANKYVQNKLILEAKLANSLNGGRMIRQTMLDDVAAELSAKFNVAARSRKYVEQKLRDMKKEARKFFYLQQNAKIVPPDGTVVNGKSAASRTPPEPIRVMIEAMADELRAGSANGDHESCGKQLMGCEKLEIDVEHDYITSRQSAASTSGESATGAPSSDPADDDEHGAESGGPHLHLNSQSDDCGEKTKFPASFDPMSAASWSSLYGQSLTAALLMGLGGACPGAENFSFPNGHNVKSSPAIPNSTDFDLFNAALRQFATDGSNSDVGATLPAAGGDVSAAELFKTLAASSLLMPPNFYLPSVGGVGEKNSAASRKESLPAAHRNKARDAKNTLNPCSPFSASVSNASESPRIPTGQSAQRDSSERLSYHPTASAELRPKIRAEKLVRARRLFGGARLRHSAMRRLHTAIQYTAMENSGKAVDIVASTADGQPLGSLKRRLLLEEIDASKAFTTLCLEVRKSIGEAVKCFMETQRLHAQLLRAQLTGDAPPGGVPPENSVITTTVTGERVTVRARKRKNPMTLLTLSSDGSEIPQVKTAGTVF